MLQLFDAGHVPPLVPCRIDPEDTGRHELQQAKCLALACHRRQQLVAELQQLPTICQQVLFWTAVCVHGR
jgi:hypothetical protein